jgi:hypothetical protein
MKNMKLFLTELEDLMIKHKATILRSGSSRGELVVSILNEDDSFTDIEFSEEMSPNFLSEEFYKVVN